MRIHCVVTVLLILSISCWIGCEQQKPLKPTATNVVVQKETKPYEVYGEISSAYHVTIDYSTPFETLLQEGKYGWTDSKCTRDNFPLTGTGKQEMDLFLVEFCDKLDTEAVEKELSKYNLISASMIHLLAFAKSFPDDQRRNPIVALNATYKDAKGISYVPMLDVMGRERDLFINSKYLDTTRDNGKRQWGNFIRFLVYKEKK